MITMPIISTVADLQRRYRFLVEKLKKEGKPMVVVSNGKPDVVVMDVSVYEDQVERLMSLEEGYLLRLAEEGLKESKAGKTVWLKKNQKLLDLIQ